jgi:hypothetical protein
MSLGGTSSYRDINEKETVVDDSFSRVRGGLSPIGLYRRVDVMIAPVVRHHTHPLLKE